MDTEKRIRITFKLPTVLYITNCFAVVFGDVVDASPDDVENDVGNETVSDDAIVNNGDNKDDDDNDDAVVAATAAVVSCDDDGEVFDESDAVIAVADVVNSGDDGDVVDDNEQTIQETGPLLYLIPTLLITTQTRYN